MDFISWLPNLRGKMHSLEFLGVYRVRLKQPTQGPQSVSQHPEIPGSGNAVIAPHEH
jgi:hypothetical protein